MNRKRRPEQFLPLRIHGVEILVDRMSTRIKRIEKNIKSAVSLGGTKADKELIFNKYDEPRDRLTLEIPSNVTGEELENWRNYHRILLEDLHKSIYFGEETPEMKIIKDDDEYYLVRLVDISRKREMNKVGEMNVHLDENGKSWAEIAHLTEEQFKKIIMEHEEE